MVVLALVLSSVLGVISPYISSSFYYDEVLSQTGKYYGELILVLSLIVSMSVDYILI